MNFLSNPIVAKLMWALPLLMFTICAALVQAGMGQRNAAERGEVIVARIDSVDIRERAEITHGAVYLTYRPPGMTDEVTRPVEMQLVFVKDLEGREGGDIEIRVDPGSGQIVRNDHSRAQWVLTLSFAGMALIGGLGLVWLVGGWNRFLRREGDPGERGHTS